MIILQSGKTDKIIVTSAAPGDPEEIVGKIIVTTNGLSHPVEDEIIFIKRDMLGTCVEVFIPEVDLENAYIDSFNVIPSTVVVTQVDHNVLFVDIPTKVLEEDIELNVTLDYVQDPQV